MEVFHVKHNKENWNSQKKKKKPTQKTKNLAFGII